MDDTPLPAVCHARTLALPPLIAAFRDHLDGGDLDRAIGDEGIRFRDRLFPPAVVFWIFLVQVFHSGASCRNALLRLLAARHAAAACGPAIHTGSYCKARQRLPEGLLVRLGRLVAGRALGAAKPWDWKGHPVQMVDGTTISMPDTPANRKAYPPPKSQKPGIGFPLARLVAVVGLASGCVLRTGLARWTGKGKGEGSLLAGMLGEFKPNDLVLGDRAFAAYWLLASLAARRVHFVGALAVRRRIDYRTGRRLGPTDHVVAWRKPAPRHRNPGLSAKEWAALPETIEVREMRVAVERRGFRTQVLHIATTLLDAEAYPKADVAALYRRRWQVELHFRALKAEMELGVLRCKSPAMVRKEVAMHMLVHNLVRAVMIRAGASVRREPSRISFTAAREAIEAFAPLLAAPERREDAWEAMLQLIGSQHVDDRPGRVEPRVVKRRPKPQKRMDKPRNEYQRITRSEA